MTTKREFLAGSAALLAASAAMGRDSRDPASSKRVVSVDVVVYNDLYPEACAFAAAATARGAIALPILGDAGVLWYGTLRKLVADGKRRIAGMGTYTDSFILETLGRDERLRMRQLCRHECRGSRLVSWELT